MSDWREWLEQAERERNEAQEAFQVGDSKPMVHWALRYGHRLTEGYKLLSEAVEARENRLQHEKKHLMTDRIAFRDIRAHEAAVTLLRGVGRD